MSEAYLYFDRPDRETWIQARLHCSLRHTIENFPGWEKEDIPDIPLSEEQMLAFVEGYAPGWDCRYAPYLLHGWFYITRSGHWLKKFRYKKRKDGYYHVTEHYTTGHSKGMNLLAQVLTEGKFCPRIIDDRLRDILRQIPDDMKYNREYTPEHISALRESEIFVFGSNIHGAHGGGAAAFAHRYFGAEWGVGEGLTGRCYALPTMEGGVDYIGGKVRNFIECARQHQELKFYVTPIACGIAGFSPDEIAPLFSDAIGLANVILPEQFVRIIER